MITIIVINSVWKTNIFLFRRKIKLKTENVFDINVNYVNFFLFR